MILSVTAAMINTLVKPNNLIERKSPQENVSKITLSLQPYIIICFFVRQFCPEYFSILAKSSSDFKIEIQERILIKLLKSAKQKHLLSTVIFVLIMPVEKIL